MLTLTCPCCGIDADETELAAGGQAHLKRFGPGSSDDEFHDYLFMRENPRGLHFERWRHAYGCGKWFHAARDTNTLEVLGTYPAQTTEPPAALRKILADKYPGWSWGAFS
jgi:sarcosine oxidase subunit delta